MGSQRLGVLHWRCWRSLPAACVRSQVDCQSLRPWLAWHLSSPWRYMGHSWYPELLSCCWGVASSLSDDIFSLHGDWQHLFSQITYFLSRNGLPRVSQPFFLKMVFFEMWQRLWLSKRWKSLPFSEHFACICCVQIFFCVRSGPSRKNKTQDNRVGKDVGNERGVLRGGRGDPDRCRLGWWGWR